MADSDHSMPSMPPARDTSRNDQSSTGVRLYGMAALDRVRDEVVALGPALVGLAGRGQELIAGSSFFDPLGGSVTMPLPYATAFFCQD